MVISASASPSPTGTPSLSQSRTPTSSSTTSPSQTSAPQATSSTSTSPAEVAGIAVGVTVGVVAALLVASILIVRHTGSFFGCSTGCVPMATCCGACPLRGRSRKVMRSIRDVRGAEMASVNNPRDLSLLGQVSSRQQTFLPRLIRRFVDVESSPDGHSVIIAEAIAPPPTRAAAFEAAGEWLHCCASGVCSRAEIWSLPPRQDLRRLTWVAHSWHPLGRLPTLST